MFSLLLCYRVVPFYKIFINLIPLEIEVACISESLSVKKSHWSRLPLVLFFCLDVEPFSYIPFLLELRIGVIDLNLIFQISISLRIM